MSLFLSDFNPANRLLRPDNRRKNQAGGVLAHLSLGVFALALVIGTAAIIYLGTASMPAPSQPVQKPIPDAQIKKR